MNFVVFGVFFLFSRGLQAFISLGEIDDGETELTDEAFTIDSLTEDDILYTFLPSMQYNVVVNVTCLKTVYTWNNQTQSMDESYEPRDLTLYHLSEEPSVYDPQEDVTDSGENNLWIGVESTQNTLYESFLYVEGPSEGNVSCAVTGTMTRSRRMCSQETILAMIGDADAGFAELDECFEAQECKACIGTKMLKCVWVEGAIVTLSDGNSTAFSAGVEGGGACLKGGPKFTLENTYIPTVEPVNNLKSGEMELSFEWSEKQYFICQKPKTIKGLVIGACVVAVVLVLCVPVCVCCCIICCCICCCCAVAKARKNRDEWGGHGDEEVEMHETMEEKELKKKVQELSDGSEDELVDDDDPYGWGKLDDNNSGDDGKSDDDSDNSGSDDLGAGLSDGSGDDVDDVSDDMV